MIYILKRFESNVFIILNGYSPRPVNNPTRFPVRSAKNANQPIPGISVLG